MVPHLDVDEKGERGLYRPNFKSIESFYLILGYIFHLPLLSTANKATIRSCCFFQTIPMKMAQSNAIFSLN